MKLFIGVTPPWLVEEFNFGLVLLEVGIYHLKYMLFPGTDQNLVVYDCSEP